MCCTKYCIINPEQSSDKTTIYLQTLYRLAGLPAAIHKDTYRKIRTIFVINFYGTNFGSGKHAI